jgi:hypothetical protein
MVTLLSFPWIWVKAALFIAVLIGLFAYVIYQWLKTGTRD